jgi:hypothetical protein
MKKGKRLSKAEDLKMLTNPIRYVTGGEPGRGRGVAGVGRDLEASNYISANRYIIT